MLSLTMNCFSTLLFSAQTIRTEEYVGWAGPGHLWYNLGLGILFLSPLVSLQSVSMVTVPIPRRSWFQDSCPCLAHFAV